MNAYEVVNFFKSNLVELQVVDGKIRCKAPQGFMTAALLDALKINKQEIIALLAPGESGEPVRLQTQREITCPASFAQQRLWFLVQLDPAGVSYNVPVAVRLGGPLDAVAFKLTLNEIVRRHEALRTTFATLDGAPVQVIAASLDLPLPLTDLCNVPAGEREAEARRLLQQEARLPFDLNAGPLIRAGLLRLAATEHIVILTLHHIVSDAWSTGVLVNEVAALYAAYAQGRPQRLPELRIQYADFARQQRERLRGETLASQIGYWQRQLAGAPNMLLLPADRPRQLLPRHRGATHPFDVPAPVTSGLRAVGRQSANATLFMVLAAAFNVLLSRYAGQSDICVGMPIANRNRAELESLIGFFVNTLVLRTQVDGDAPFTELLQQVRGTALDAYAHQDVPFDLLVETLKPERHTSHAPLFQAMLVVQNAPVGNLNLPGLTLAPVALETSVTQFDLTLVIGEVDDRLSAAFQYDRDLFEAATIARMAGHFTRLLEAIVAEPASRIGALDMLAAAEREQLLVTWNDTANGAPRGACVHQLFEAQAARIPHAIAVEFGGAALTYADLNERANRLAHRLREMGVQADVRVAICVERSIEMIVAMLAVLKAGGAYVPLDPAYPAERLAYLLDDAQPAVLLTQERLTSVLPAHATPTLRVDADSRQWDGMPAHSPLAIAAPHDLAYVIYTSGSTGLPKGVMVEHAGLGNLVLAQIASFGVTGTSRVPQLASISFDACASEVLMALCQGAALCLPPPGVLAGADLHAFLRERRISHATLTPAVLAGLPESAALDALHTLVIAGEALPLALLQRWGQGRRVINAYGPTEATVCATLCVCDAGSPSQPPIGRPLPNVRIYILDAYGQPVPVGVTGELFIGGAGVARGYLNRADLSAQRFVDDPFATAANARMYRSGDLARYRIDGEIDYLGRNDDQVKIRGLRIEPGEIEAQLRTYPGVGEVIVLAREDVPGEPQLVAYYSAAQDLPVRGLAAHAAAALPQYMRPAAYVRIDTLPLTVNGKLDRGALPAPDGAPGLARAYEAPVGHVEATLARLWSVLLKVERVGRHDNFFDLGGHSLLGVSMIERMREEGLHAEVSALFTTATLAELAACVDGRDRDVQVPLNRLPAGAQRITPEMLSLVTLSQQEIDSIVAKVPGGAANLQEIYPLAPLQQGILFHHLMSTEGDPYLLSTLYGFTSRARLERFLKAAQRVVDRHDILRTSLAWEGLSEPVQVVMRAVDLPVQEVEFDAAQGDIAEQMEARYDRAHYRIDVGAAPLLRCFVAHDVAQGRWLLRFLAHHLAMDHTALELLTLEAQLIDQGRAAELPAPAPYRNFVAQASLGVSRQEHEDFFRGMLGDIDAPTAPFGLFGVRGDGRDVREARHTLAPALSATIRQLARGLGVSAASLMHLAWALVLARTSGRAQVVFGTVLFGRMQSGTQTDRALGLFINTLPLRIDVAQGGVESALQHTHALLAQLMRHEHAPLALAQRCSALAAHAPLFTALLNYRHSAPKALASTDEMPRDAADEILFLSSGEERTNYPLCLNIDDTGVEFMLTAQIGAGIDPQRICAFMDSALRGLSRALETAPSTPAAQIDVLPTDEHRQLMLEWNAPAPYPQDRCIHALFEAQAARNPQQVALVLGEQQLTYAALNGRANRLARHLRGMGVGPDVLVAICVERSLEMIVGLLGILKAGGAYVPLDPSYPPERIAYVLNDARPAVLLTQHHLRDALPSLSREELATFYLDTQQDLLIDYPATDPGYAVQPDNLAYVIYTSGSTGKPKGALLRHANVQRLFAASAGHFRFDRDDIWTLFHSYAFDFSVWEIWGALLHGGKLVIVPFDISRTPARFHALLAQQKVTVLNQTPSAFLQLTAADAQLGAASPLSLRYVIFGGEALNPATLAPWFAAHDDAVPALINMYGITETTVHVTWHRLHADASAKASIGRPLSDLATYILDANLQPTPQGVAGELHVAGDGLARGYLNRGDLTADKFIANPFSSAPGARMYKTGDLARYQADGAIEYLGRNDHQVKIRGFRIELGEIEAALTAVASVREAVVLAREDSPGDQRLAAYVVRRDRSTSEPDTSLRAALSATLPDYMVPADYLFLDALPMTPNGKLDRQALPAPARVRGDSGYVAPRTPTEVDLAAIWCAVLQRDRVGIHDDFFQFGGHSLLVMKLAAAVQKRFAVDIPVALYFSMTTVSRSAECIDASVAKTMLDRQKNEASLAEIWNLIEQSGNEDKV
jgi:amino acid adenylation domain-containing protein